MSQSNYQDNSNMNNDEEIGLSDINFRIPKHEQIKKMKIFLGMEDKFSEEDDEADKSGRSKMEDRQLNKYWEYCNNDCRLVALFTLSTFTLF